MANGLRSWPGEIPEELALRIKSELEPGESLLWAATGNPRLRTSGSNLTARVIWSLGFLSFGIVAVVGAVKGSGSSLGAIVGLFAVAGVLAGSIGTFTFCLGVIGGAIARWKSNRRLAMTLYAVTDRRAIIWKPSASSSATLISSYHRGKIKNVSRAEFPDGSGDVELRLERRASGEPTAFEGIADVRQVEDLVRRTLIES